MTWLWLLAFAALGAAQVGEPLRQDTLAVNAVRFYRGGSTLVEGFISVPYAALDPVSLTGGGFAAFRLDVEVADSSAAVLKRESWSRRVAWQETRTAGASSVELLNFALAPGRYVVRVALTDSASGRRVVTETNVTAYGASPEVSDLLLAERIRAARGADTTPREGEIRRGDLFVTAAPDLVLRPSAATLYVYGEAYREHADTVGWHLEVLAPDGQVVTATAAQTVAVAAGGGVITGALDLGGLPAGTYTLRAVVGEGTGAVSRTARFRMGGLELDRRVARVAQQLETPVDTFAQASEQGLDSLFAPLVELPESGNLQAYGTLTVEGKRRFLRTFWAQRDLTPGTARNEAMEGFYARIAEADRRFAEGGAGAVPGWRTDRGRIFVLHGEPDDVLRRPSTGSAPPWEVWKYTKDRSRRYVFLDETRLGHFALIYSDDRQERSYPNWDAIIGQEAAEEILRF